ncbi:hypothetical protein G9A89_003675 [Geosiphon pyriformis]|nr:hypothetical protein G9A89_003675 [Geosiphon pyriformis]
MGNKLSESSKSFIEDNIEPLRPRPGVIVHSFQVQNDVPIRKLQKKPARSKTLDQPNDRVETFTKDRQKRIERRHTSHHYRTPSEMEDDPRNTAYIDTPLINHHFSYTKSLRHQHHTVVSANQEKRKRLHDKESSGGSLTDLRSEALVYGIATDLNRRPSHTFLNPYFSQISPVYNHLPPSPVPGSLRVVNRTPIQTMDESKEDQQRHTIQLPVTQEIPLNVFKGETRQKRHHSFDSPFNNGKNGRKLSMIEEQQENITNPSLWQSQDRDVFIPSTLEQLEEMIENLSNENLEINKPKEGLRQAGNFAEQDFLHPANVHDFFGKNSNSSLDLSNSSVITSISEISDIIEMEIDEEGARTVCRGCRLSGIENFCESCHAQKIRNSLIEWTCGNRVIDNFIMKTQMMASGRFNYVEWIDFNRFQDIHFLSQGGFSKVYSAIWLDWPTDQGPRKVALKVLDNSHNLDFDFFLELERYFEKVAHSSNTNLIHCYGITQDPESGDYSVVLEYAEIGNIQQCLRHNFSRLSWTQKLCMLYDITKGLESLHNGDVLHRNLHTRNMLVYNIGHLAYSAIGDIGLNGPAYLPRNSEHIFGVLPFVAPEVLSGMPYTKAADVYSFGMVLWEFCTGRLPFSDVPHDEMLAQSIYYGRRPSLDGEIPNCMAWLIRRCWHDDVTRRPNANKLQDILNDWVLKVTNEKFKNEHVARQFTEAEKIRLENLRDEGINSPISFKQHPQAIYTSRMLDFPSLRRDSGDDDLSINREFP